MDVQGTKTSTKNVLKENKVVGFHFPIENLLQINQDSVILA